MESTAHRHLVPTIERATHAIALLLEPTLKQLDITQAEAHVLAHLSSIDECSINDLHHGFGHKRSTLTNVLDRLEARGLVRRAPHPSSRRSLMVQLTENGHDAAKQVAAEIERLDRRVADKVDPADREGFQRVITAVMEVSRDG